MQYTVITFRGTTFKIIRAGVRHEDNWTTGKTNIVEFYDALPVDARPGMEPLRFITRVDDENLLNDMQCKNSINLTHQSDWSIN